MRKIQSAAPTEAAAASAAAAASSARRLPKDGDGPPEAQVEAGSGTRCLHSLKNIVVFAPVGFKGNLSPLQGT